MTTGDARVGTAAGMSWPLTLAGRVRIAARGSSLLVAVLVAVPLHYIWRLLRRRSPWPRRFLGWVAWLAGARVERIGTPRRRDVFFVANHLSWIDILALAGASGTTFVAKQELRRAPVVGWLATLNRTVFVEREDRLGVAAQIDRVRRALVENGSIAIFPEGTTGDDATLLPFKTSMLRVLEPPPPGVLVQPVLMDYGALAQEIGWFGEETGLHNALRVLARPGGFALRIHFLPPFDPAAFAGRKAIAAEARRRIADALAAVSAHQPDEPSRTTAASGALARRTDRA